MPYYPITGYIVAAGFGRDRDHSAFAAIDDRPPVSSSNSESCAEFRSAPSIWTWQSGSVSWSVPAEPQRNRQWKEPAVEGEFFAPHFPAACGSKAVS